VRGRSDHCPAMKGIETSRSAATWAAPSYRSDHCPAMKGIETWTTGRQATPRSLKRPLPRNEGD